jgi:uncharacterized membrane protein HdeD (DUF308 family)
MSTVNSSGGPVYRPHFARVIQEDLQELRASWFWFALLGGALIVLGVVALAYSLAATIVTTLIFGWMLLIGGVFYLVGAFFTRGWGGFFLSLLAGVLHLAVGVIVVNHPAEAAVVYTLVLAVFFFVEGLFRVVAALAGRFRHWGWMLLSGLVTLLLGVLIWRDWPFSGLWVVGTFVGINLIFSGASDLALGLHAKNLPAPAEGAAAPV